MRFMKETLIIAIAVFCLVTTDATAQGTAGGRGGGGGMPRLVLIDNPFEGVVSSINPGKLSVKGKVTLSLARSNDPNSMAAVKSVVDREAVYFDIKGATLTRDGKPCAAKDVQRGDAASVRFAIKDKDRDSNSPGFIVSQNDKLVASQVDFSTKSKR